MINKIFAKITTPVWLEGLLGVVILLRIPSFLEPFSYGDEMIYLTLGEGIRKGLVLYKDIHDNKPPFLYFLAAVAGNVFWFKVILAIWSLIAIVVFWKLMKKLFEGKEKLVMVSTISFAALTTLPLLEGNIANAENFMIGLSILAFLFALSAGDKVKHVFVAGILFSLATLFKVPAAFEAPVIVVYWLITGNKFSKVIKRSFYLALGFFVPILLSFVWYYLRGALGEYFVAAFAQNFGYLSSWRPSDATEPFITRNGPLLLRGLMVVVGIGLMFIRRKKLSKTFVFGGVWLLFSLFAVTLSERPYPHYLLQAAGPASIFIAMAVSAKSMEQIYAIIPLFAILLVPVYFKYYYYPTFSYYQRFLEFASGRIDREQYFNRFDGNVNRNYKIAEYINASTKMDDGVFVWGDSPPIYALSRRLPPFKYVAGYHINDFSSHEELVSALTQNKPRLIIILPGGGKNVELERLVAKYYIRASNIEGAVIWRLLK